MPRRNYHKAHQHWLLWLAICFTGIAVEAGLLIWLSSDKWTVLPWGWTMVVAVLPFVGAVFFGQFVMARLKRQRIEQLAEACRELGFHLHPKPTAGQKTAMFAPLAGLAGQLELRHEADALVWIAPSRVAGSSEMLLEHEYTTGSGRFIQVFTHTVVAWPVAHASIQGTHLVNPAPFSLSYDPLLRRRVLQKTARDVPSLGNLGKTLRVYGNPEGAARFLTPAVRTQLAGSPVGERWYVGNGWVCCLYAGDLDAANLTAFVKHAHHVLISAVG